ncbi:MAG: NAD(P)H-dependent oxidoreductase [Flavobacteriales bacterium]|nr:NAD(P)H-dependent oxidoreductase [Flavobacteriales bacterium]
MRIAIISGSVREGRQSHRAAIYLRRMAEAAGHQAEILDLKEFDFPLFTERLKHQQQPHAGAVEFARRISQSDGVILVTPEYNGGYPASVKNIVDLLTDEWKRKPVAICTVSDGSFGGTQVITSLLFSLWKIKAWVVNAHLPVPNVSKAFDEDGIPADPEPWAKRASAFLAELTWAMEAASRLRG